MAFKVAIDAGHGSNTAGKRTPDGYREHWINVKTAYYCDLALKRCDIQTVKIAWDNTNAKDDPDVSLNDRIKRIKDAGCDVAISMHANAFGNGVDFNSASGVVVYVHSTPGQVKDSKKLAECIHKYIIQGTKQVDRGVKSNQFAMCSAGMMGVKGASLIEIGFMTNKIEADLMKGEAFCKEQGEQVAMGVCEYLGVKYVKEAPKPVTPAPAKIKVKVGDKVSYTGVLYSNSNGGRTVSVKNRTMYIKQVVNKGKYPILLSATNGGVGIGWVSAAMLGAKVSTPVPMSTKVYYTVQKGDTLSKIAIKYKTTVDKLVKLNSLNNPNLISVGKKIRVK